MSPEARYDPSPTVSPSSLIVAPASAGPSGFPGQGRPFAASTLMVPGEPSGERRYSEADLGAAGAAARAAVGTGGAGGGGPAALDLGMPWHRQSRGSQDPMQRE